MKNILIVGLLLIAFNLTSCRNEVPEEIIIWDFSNLEIEFKLFDKNTGENLLDPSTERNYLNNNITCEYKGEIYEICNIDSPVVWPTIDNAGSTRFVPPVNLGLRYITANFVYNEKSGQYELEEFLHLSFGEFGTTSDLHEQEVIINWGDGTSNRVVFDCYIEWISKTEPKVHHDIWLDGEKIEGTICEIYK